VSAGDSPENVGRSCPEDILPSCDSALVEVHMVKGLLLLRTFTIFYYELPFTSKTV
jgi:hypothetical protein